MDTRTLAAIKASVTKWEKNVEVKSARHAEVGVGSCALCAIFYEAGCVECPVYARTGKSACDETPYSLAWKTWDAWFDTELGGFSREEFSKRKKEWQDAAQAEVDFLRSLLPEGERA